MPGTSGTSGTDSITGNSPGKLVEAGAGNDPVNGGEGMDYLQGNAGADSLSGGGGGDQLLGGRDNDFVHGNAGNDTCFGDDGDDIVRGGQGNDLVNGGNGNDFVSGDKGDDTISGGAGADLFHTFGEAGLDLVIDFDAAEGDRVNLDPGAQYTVAQVGGDTVITLTGGGQMVLQGVQLSALTDGWIVGA
jgi:Ca2+-binding RTX toxin-like protein